CTTINTNIWIYIKLVWTLFNTINWADAHTFSSLLRTTRFKYYKSHPSYLPYYYDYILHDKRPIRKQIYNRIYQKFEKSNKRDKNPLHLRLDTYSVLEKGWSCYDPYHTRDCC